MSSGSESDEKDAGNQIKKKSVNDLIKAIQDSKGQYAFLIGAGSSRPAGIPTSKELIEEWKRDAYEHHRPDLSFQEWVSERETEVSDDNNEYGFWFEQVYSTLEQRRQYIEEHVVANAEPQFGHIVLASMMVDVLGEKYVPMTFTPNFDDLLYDAFYYFLDERPLLISHNALATQFRFTDEKPKIIKVHGDYLYQNVKNLNDETDSLESEIEDVIIQAVGEYGLVVVGYGGYDKSIMRPLIESNRAGAGVFWCVREKSELSKFAQELLHQPNTFLVEVEGSEELFSKFFTRIDDLRAPQAGDISERVKRRASDLREKRKEAMKHAPPGEGERFEISELVDEASEYTREGEYDKAEVAYKNIFEKEPDGDNVLRLYSLAHSGYANILNNEFEKPNVAKDHLERAIEIDPELIGPRYTLADLLIRDLDEPEEAVKVLESIIEINPESVSTLDQIAYRFYTDLDKPARAKEIWERALEINPGRSEIHSNLGHVLQFYSEDFEEAKRHFEMSLELDEENATAHNNYGHLLFTELGKPNEAKKHLERAFEIDPEMENPYKHLASLYYQEFDQADDARDYVEKAIEINPEYAEAHFLLAELLQNEFNEPEEASVHYEKAAELDSDYETMDENLVE